MENIKFKDIIDIQMLSNFLRIQESSITLLLERQDDIFDPATYDPVNKNIRTIDAIVKSRNAIYLKMYLPKKNQKGYRVVYKVQDETLKNILKVLQKYLNENYIPLDCVHGFVNKKNVKTNANEHLGKKYIYNFDIKNFFPSITREQIFNCFKKLECNDLIADCLSKLTTLNGYLAQGFYTSPLLANLVLENFDIELSTFCKSNDFVYTRYADDIYVSGNNEISPLETVEKIVNKSGFFLNKEKAKKMKRGQNQYVTGLTVFDKNYPRIPKKIKRRIRFTLYYLNKYGRHSFSERFDENENNYFISSSSELKGWIDYVNSIEPDLAKKYYKLYNKAYYGESFNFPEED